jgi:hypothetical protein
VLCYRRDDDDDDDHGVRRADSARALARWRRFGALHEALETPASVDVACVVLTWRHGRQIRRRLGFIYLFIYI